MDYKDFGVYRVSFPMGHYEDLPGGGRRWVDDSPKLGRVQLLIDTDALVRQLGAKALKSKTGRAIEAGGLVKVIRLESSPDHAS